MSALISSSALWLLILYSLLSLQQVSSLTVAVFGGSGFVGRRISSVLINAGCDVISISRSGKPPSYYCRNSESPNDDTNWSDAVIWIQHNFDGSGGAEESSSPSSSLQLPKIDAAISCIGNVQPDPDWLKSSFFGLAFNDKRLYTENGLVNEAVVKVSKEAGAERFIYLTPSYEVAKMVEGPLEGYMDGKRYAEKVACELFGLDNTILLSASLIYGGNRFSKFGGLYRKFVESPIAKAYVGGNQFLRNLSSAPLEDWVEQSLFSSPVDVGVVARVASAAAMGYVTRNMVNDRRQGFFDLNGKPIFYDNAICVDGTFELERIDKIAKLPVAPSSSMGVVSALKELISEEKEPSFEGALIGKGPFLYPLPIIGTFASLFFAIASGQFITVSN